MGRSLSFCYNLMSKKMSWLDSSFSFAKTALSQAQKSIDRVLDIKEHSEDGQTEPARPAGWCLDTYAPVRYAYAHINTDEYCTSTQVFTSNS